jgi:hypothetical protein
MPTGAVNGSLWLDTDATSTTVFEQCWRRAVTTAGTTISGNDDYSLALAYTVGFEQVYLNGVLLVRAVDYTATDGTSIVLTTATTVGDYVEIITTSTFTAANTYTQAAANAAFPLNTSSFFAGKNKIINGDCFYNQRAFSSQTLTTETSVFIVDRFSGTNVVGGSSAFSVQQFTPGTAPIAGYEAKQYMRVVSSGQSSGFAGTIFTQRIEDVRTLAGQTVTVSFFAKAASGTPNVSIEFVETFGTGGSPSARLEGVGGVQKFAISTSWVRYSRTFTLPSLAGKTLGTNNDSVLELNIWVSAGTDFNSRTSSLGIQSNTFDIWGVQLEAGSVATAFQTASGSIGGELALCQRYYERISAGSLGLNDPIAWGMAASSTTAVVFFPMKVTKRAFTAAVTWVDLRLVGWNLSGTINVNAPTVVTASPGGTNNFALAVTAAGMTAGLPVFIDTNGTSGFLAVSAEL